MKTPSLHIVTGAFGYTGKYIAQRLLAHGVTVRTLTNSPSRANPFGRAVAASPFHFAKPALLIEAMRGADVLYNTYWVRFNHAAFNHETAVQNTLTLFDAARAAGVRRVVHVSITNPSEDSPLEYFSGKARLERALNESGLSHSILRPAVVFGREDILINNIAWMLRTFPIFGLFGDGTYRLQPIFVDDLAALAVEEGRGEGNRVIDAIGPEAFSYRELVETIGRLIGCARPIVALPPWIGYAIGWVVGKFVRDVVITREEIEGLMSDLLRTDSPPTGSTKLTEWIAANRDSLGVRYAGEVIRRMDRRSGYDSV